MMPWTSLSGLLLSGAFLAVLGLMVPALLLVVALRRVAASAARAMADDVFDRRPDWR